MDFDLLLQQIADPIIRENFRRIKFEIQSLIDGQSTSSGSTAGGSTGTTIVSPWTRFTTNIDAVTTKVIDSVKLSDFKKIVYEVTFYNVVEGKTRGFRIDVVNNGSSVSDKISSILGDYMDYEVNVNLNSGKMELEIVNNEAFRIDSILAKLVL